MGFVCLVSFLSVIEIRISGISGIRLLFEWNKHWMNRDRSDHQWCKEVNGKTCNGACMIVEWNSPGINWDRSDHQWCKDVNGKAFVLTVDGKKFANI